MTEASATTQTRDFLAAEFALGLLDSDDRIAAMRLRLSDPEFAVAVAKWEARIADWLGELPEEPIDETRWDAIAAALARQGQGNPAGSTAAVRPSGTQPWGWRFATLAASLAALGFAGLWATGNARLRESEQIARNQPVSKLDSISIAQIRAAKGTDLVAAVFDRTSGVLSLRLAAIDQADKVPELWLINGAAAPRSLGLARSGQVVRLTLTPELRALFSDGATMAITLEPPSPKPHAKPSGAILGTARITAI